MLIEKLKTWSYYKNKLPLYLQNSYGFDEHFKMLFDLLVKLDTTQDEIIKAYDILNTSYLNYISTVEDTDNYTFDVLDKIAELFGVRRSFDVTYDNNGTETTASLHLTNSELLKLIKAQIINNNYDGTYETSRQFYDTMKLPVYLLLSGNPAEVYVTLDNSAQLTKNEQILFLANMFTIKSMGIIYHTSIVEIISVMIWDSKDSNRYWNKGRWV